MKWGRVDNACFCHVSSCMICTGKKIPSCLKMISSTYASKGETSPETCALLCSWAALPSRLHSHIAQGSGTAVSYAGDKFCGTCRSASARTAPSSALPTGGVQRQAVKMSRGSLWISCMEILVAIGLSSWRQCDSCGTQQIIMRIASIFSFNSCSRKRGHLWNEPSKVFFPDFSRVPVKRLESWRWDQIVFR